MKKVGLVLVSYQHDAFVLSLLDALLKVYGMGAINVYVTQIGSHPKIKAILAHAMGVTLMRVEKNGGYAWGCNLGMKRALADGCEYLVIQNTDTYVDNDYLQPLVDQLKQPNIGLVSPKIYFSPGKEFHHNSYTKNEQGKIIWYAGGVIDWDNVLASHWGVDEVDHGQFSQAFQTDFATGCCLAIRADTIEKVGFLDERYFLYYEDADWSVRATRKGYLIMCEPDSALWHINAGSTGGSGSSLHQYYQTRNRIFFARTFAPIRSQLSVMRESIEIVLGTKGGQRKAVVDGLLGLGGRRYA